MLFCEKMKLECPRDVLTIDQTEKKRKFWTKHHPGFRLSFPAPHIELIVYSKDTTNIIVYEDYSGSVH